MKIAVNTRLLLPGRLDGIGWFTYETLRRITINNPQHTFYFLFDRPWDRQFIFSGNIEPVLVRPPARHPFLWLAWFELSVPYVLKRLGADLFVSPDGYLSLRTKVPSLAVIHDINFHHRPQDLPYLTRKYHVKLFPKFAKKADKIATVSEYSKNDLIDAYGVDSEKIHVVYNGVNESYGPLDEFEKAKVMQKYTQGVPYFIFIGTLLPRKNIQRLLRAYEQFRRMSNEEVHLIIVGDKKFGTKDLQFTYDSMSFKNEVHFVGRKEPEELHRLIASAMALTFVPVFEGFGIPILEAFRCGTPVICSNVTSMPEVAGDAAVLADPFNVSSISDAMIKIAEDKALRIKLTDKGLRRSGDFSWDRTAKLFGDVINSF